MVELGKVSYQMSDEEVGASYQLFVKRSQIRLGTFAELEVRFCDTRFDIRCQMRKLMLLVSFLGKGLRSD